MRLSNLELAYAKELGLGPQARVAIGVDVARGEYFRDLAAEMQAAHRDWPAS